MAAPEPVPDIDEFGKNMDQLIIVERRVIYSVARIAF